MTRRETARHGHAHARGGKPNASAVRAHRATFEAYVKRKGLRSTKQRDTILDVFLSSSDHLTGEDLHARVVERDRTIGLSTVYRTLKLFVDANIASERHFNDGRTRFEVVQPHHDHLICLGCGRIVEFERDEIEALQDDVAASHGFKLVSHRHELYGYCKTCPGE